MRYGWKRAISAAVAMLMCATILLGMIPAVSASGTVAPLGDLDRFDFGVPWAEDNVTLSASELFERMFAADGVTLISEERAYLDERLYTLKYNPTIPSDAVQTNYDKTAGTLDVVVPIYSYRGENGEILSWIPVEAKLGDTTETMTENGTVYTCHFDGLDYGADFEMAVSFTARVHFDEAAVRAMLMQSKTDGEAARELIEQYILDKATYDQAYSAYRAWVEYPAKRAARDEYDRKYAEYLEKKAAYDAYIVDADTYEARVKAYEEYLVKKAQYEADWEKYEAYKVALSQYQTAYNAYTAYRDSAAAARAQLEVMEKLFVTDSHGYQLYATTLGPTVSTVLARRDELEIAGKGAQVEAAGEATDALRLVLQPYSELRKSLKNASEHDKYKALHAYYRANYQSIKNNFRKLYEALYNLYSEGIVSDYIEQDGKEHHFQQFLGQLYLTTCCLDDAEALKLTWTPTTKVSKTLTQVVEECHMMSDSVKADPTNVTHPHTLVTEPTPVEKVEPPVAPTVVHEPDVPVPVEKPTAPLFVEDPGAEPPRAEDPGEAPTPPALSEVMTNWADFYVEVDYEGREELIGERTLTLTTTMTREVSVDNLLYVRFYDYDGTLIGKTEYTSGDSLAELSYPIAPSRDANAQYVYEFAGWKRFDGTALTASTITNDISLRAAYQRFLCRYQITWRIDGKVDKVEYWDYGTVPTYHVSNKVEGKYDYVFSGWSPTVSAVTSDATYDGHYQKILRTHTVTWRLDGGSRIERETLEESKLPTYEGVKDYAKNNKWYAFTNWDAEIKPITADVTYTAVYRDPVFFSTGATGASNVNVSVKNGTVTAEMLETVVDFENLCDFAVRCGYDLVLMRNTVSVRFTPEALKSLRADGCKQIRFERSSETLQNGTGYVLAFLDGDGGAINTDVPVTVQYRYTAIEDGTPACYEYQNGKWTALESTRQGGVLSTSRTGGGIFWVGTAHYILYDPIETCNTLALPSRAVAGTWVELGGASCVYGYEITEILLTLADGSTLVVEGDGFEMPDGAVNITLTVEQIVYHVSFVVNGTVILEGDYLLGEQIVIPADPTLDLGDGLVYTFTGWSPAVTLAGGEERNIVYTAQFMSSAPITEEEQLAMESNDILVRIIVVALVFVAVIVGVIVLVVVIRRKRR